MCIFNPDPPKNTTTNTPDPLTQQIRQYMMPFITQIMNQSYPSYPGSKRLEPFNQDQRQAFGMVGDFAQSRTNPGYDYAQQMAHQVGNAPAGHVSTPGTYGKIGQGDRFTQGYQNISTPGTYSKVGQQDRFTQMPGDIDTGRIVDEKGRLGKISDYMNPYVNRVLQPQIREIGEAAQKQKIASGQAATFGGAFGDARHGVADAQTNAEHMQAVGDTTGQAWSDAYNQAMGLRGQDEARMMAADQFNQQADEQALQRQLGAQQFNVGTQQSTYARQLQNAQFNKQAREALLGRQLGAQQFNVGTQQTVDARQLQAQLANQSLREQMFGRQMAAGQASNSYGLSANQDYLQRLNAFMNTGNLQQQQGQKLRDYDYQNFQGGVQWPFTQFNALLSTLNGQPTNPIQTQQQTTGGNSGWMNMIGSLLGAFL